MDENKTKIVDISKYSKHQPEDDIAEENFIEYGAEAFNESLKDGVGFLSIVFDSDGQPSLIWAGEVDSFVALGALETVKTLFIDKIYR